MDGAPAIPQTWGPARGNPRYANGKNPTACWRNERGRASSEAAKKTKKTSTKNSVRGAKVVADDEGVKTKRE
jgi:hypothetical protein